MARNRVILLGNVGQDPETFQFDNGNKKTSFPLATTEKYTDKNGKKAEETEWHTIVVFGKQAEVAEKYVKKGTFLYIEGKIKTRTYEKNNEKRYITEIICTSFDMLPMNKKEQSGDNIEQANDETDDLPY